MRYLTEIVLILSLRSYFIFPFMFRQYLEFCLLVHQPLKEYYLHVYTVFFFLCLIIFFLFRLSVHQRSTAKKMVSQAVSSLLTLVAVLVVPSLSSEPVSVDLVGLLVAQMVEQNFATCHLVLMTTEPHSPVFGAIQRHVYQYFQTFCLG